MEFGRRQEPGRRLAGIGFVVLLHLALIYMLVVGLSHKAIEVLPPPIETKILRDIPPPVPPPPPPPPPKFVPPPSTFVPPPEIVISTPPPRPAAITPTTTTPPPVTAAVRTAPSVSAKHTCRTPDYPPASERLGEEGAVQLSFLINPDGKVADSRVEKSSGFQRLDQAALAALSRCTFEPGTVNGVPQAVWFTMRYVWKIPE
jgi:protein TonB